MRGLEIFGHRPFMGEQSEDVHSRFSDNQGNTLDYVDEIDGDTLTIWRGDHDRLLGHRPASIEMEIG